MLFAAVNKVTDNYCLVATKAPKKLNKKFIH
jgi:hypothetical protein